MAGRRRADGEERGAIINIASTRAFMSEAGTEGYTASKGGIVALTHGMAISLARHRIRVNCISPGWIETSDWQKAAKARTPHHSKADREQHPVGRVGTPEDVAKACRFIAEDAGFMTGQNLVLDGGMTVKMIYV
jgi:NAD(P)-dependent dehydrogenase (short-subunit alcohol dehydrogenase family)